MDKIFVCIGTPRIIFDSVGPMVGSKLQDLGYEVYGTMEEPIHGTNVKDYWDSTIKKIDKHRVISIDAALSSKLKPGDLVHRRKGVIPRAGIDNSFNNIEIGSNSIVGIVGNSIDNVITSENKIKEMANDIIDYAIKLYSKNNIIIGK